MLLNLYIFNYFFLIFKKELNFKFYLNQKVIALSSLHKKRIVYRDIKPENILIDADGNIKLVDFGFAKHIEDKAWTVSLFVCVCVNINIIFVLFCF